MYMHNVHALHLFRDVQQLHAHVQSIESTDEQFSQQIEEIQISVRCLYKYATTCFLTYIVYVHVQLVYCG